MWDLALTQFLLCRVVGVAAEDHHNRTDLKPSLAQAVLLMQNLHLRALVDFSVELKVV